MRFSKADIQFHRDGYGPVNAAVNVKLHRWEWPDPAAVARDCGESAEDAAAFAAHWREIEDGKDAQAWADIAIEDGWERLTEAAREIFGPEARVYSEGRMGGWAVVAPGFDRYTAADHWRAHAPFSREEVSEWDAVAVAKWGRFVKACRETCEDIPYQAIAGYLLNVWQPEREAEREEAERAAAALESARRFSFYYDYDAPAGVGE